MAGKKRLAAQRAAVAPKSAPATQQSSERSARVPQKEALVEDLAGIWGFHIAKAIW